MVAAVVVVVVVAAAVVVVEVVVAAAVVVVVVLPLLIILSLLLGHRVDRRHRVMMRSGGDRVVSAQLGVFEQCSWGLRSVECGVGVCRPGSVPAT